eukprot:354346-Chlamydomonas_euryale.AAC.18
MAVYNGVNPVNANMNACACALGWRAFEVRQRTHLPCAAPAGRQPIPPLSTSPQINGRHNVAFWQNLPIGWHAFMRLRNDVGWHPAGTAQADCASSSALLCARNSESANKDFVDFPGAWALEHPERRQV